MIGLPHVDFLCHSKKASPHNPDPCFSTLFNTQRFTATPDRLADGVQVSVRLRVGAQVGVADTVAEREGLGVPLAVAEGVGV